MLTPSSGEVRRYLTRVHAYLSGDVLPGLDEADAAAMGRCSRFLAERATFTRGLLDAFKRGDLDAVNALLAEHLRDA